MPVTKLIADSGATKAEWCLLINGIKKTIITQGISPYFLNTEQITALLLKELKPKLKNIEVDEVYYYGTGCANLTNAKSVKKAVQKIYEKKLTFACSIVFSICFFGCCSRLDLKPLQAN